MEIPGVVSVHYGKTFTLDRAQGFTHCLVVEFESKQALPGYTPHPIHEEWAEKFIRPYKVRVLGMDIHSNKHCKI